MPSQAQIDDAVDTAQQAMSTMPKIEVRVNAKGIRARFPIGKIVMVFDERGPCPLKVDNANSSSLRLIPLNRKEMEDFLTRARAMEIAKQQLAGMTDEQKQELASSSAPNSPLNSDDRSSDEPVSSPASECPIDAAN